MPGRVGKNLALAKPQSAADKLASAKRTLKEMGLEETQANLSLYQDLKATHLRVSKKLMLENLDTRAASEESKREEGSRMVRFFPIEHQLPMCNLSFNF